MHSEPFHMPGGRDWAAFFAKVGPGTATFTLEESDDLVTWAEVFTRTAGPGIHEEVFPFSTPGKFVRLCLPEPPAPGGRFRTWFTGIPEDPGTDPEGPAPEEDPHVR